MKKVLYFILTLVYFVFPVSGEEKEVMAILSLDAKDISEKNLAVLQTEISRQFSNDTSLIVLEDEMIQLMLKEQGFDRSATCSNIQCYTGIGHLLTASKVIGGSAVLGTDKKATLTLTLVDVLKNEKVCEETATASAMSDLLQNEIPRMVRVMLEQYNQWKNNFPGKVTNVAVEKTDKKGKRPILRSIAWLSTGALVAGGAVGIYYKFFRPSHDQSAVAAPGEPDDPAVVGDVPAGDAPVHTRFR